MIKSTASEPKLFVIFSLIQGVQISVVVVLFSDTGRAILGINHVLIETQQLIQIRSSFDELGIP